MIVLAFVLAYVAVAVKLLPMLSRKILHAVCVEVYDLTPDNTDRGFALFFGVLAAALWPLAGVAVVLYDYVWSDK